MTRPYTIGGKYGLYSETEIAAEQLRLFRQEPTADKDEDEDEEED